MTYRKELVYFISTHYLNPFSQSTSNTIKKSKFYLTNRPLLQSKNRSFILQICVNAQCTLIKLISNFFVARNSESPTKNMLKAVKKYIWIISNNKLKHEWLTHLAWWFPFLKILYIYVPIISLLFVVCCLVCVKISFDNQIQAAFKRKNSYRSVCEGA